MNKHLTAFETMCSLDNLMSAWKSVRSGRIASGIDQITVAEYTQNLQSNLVSLATRAREGRYYPLPVRTVEIQKPSGGVRKLGIYTIEDTILQRAAKDVLEALFEPSFLDCSFGFRPGRSVPMAVKQVLDYRASGDLYLVDADIADCFGSFDHDILLKLFSNRIRDKRFQSLIRIWLDTGTALPNPNQNTTGVYDRVSGWLSDSVDSALSNMVNENKPGAYGYYPNDSYNIGLSEELATSPEETRKQARKEALKKLGSSGLLLALSYSNQVRKLMSPLTLTLIGTALVSAAVAPTVSNILRKQFGKNEDRLHGIVQGSAVSPLLANLYLHEFDVAMAKANFHLVRFADDFVICCKDESSARRAMDLVVNKLSELRLQLNPQKTRIIRFDEGLEFLGYRFEQFHNTATPISPKNTSPVVTLLQTAKDQIPAKLNNVRNTVTPIISRYSQQTAQQIKDKAAKLGSLFKHFRKGSD
ncbi:MAG: RNA-directed DNA polymerase [bacterium]|nr:MAG: RNA-directed DNA polymerase [bacterium]